MHKTVFKYYRENNFVAFVNEANLKMALDQMGMKLTKNVMAQTEEGVDSITKAKQYNFWFAYRE